MLLLCGYLGSGKDTVFSDIASGDFDKRWIVYSTGGKSFDVNDCVRVALADMLKKYTLSKYNLDPNIQKTDLVGENRTYRDLLIHEATLAKQSNINVWCELACESISAPNHTIITDWRHRHEYEYLNKKYDGVESARVWRFVVDEPPLSMTSEHDLDNVVTDYLILTRESDFVHAVARFPQYKGFVKL